MKATAPGSLLRNLTSVAFLAAMSTVSVTVLAQTADRPTLKVGDRWRYEVRVGPSHAKSIDRSREITAARPARTGGAGNGSPLALTPEPTNAETAS